MDVKNPVCFVDFPSWGLYNRDREKPKEVAMDIRDTQRYWMRSADLSYDQQADLLNLWDRQIPRSLHGGFNASITIDLMISGAMIDDLG
jgi:hypothetical protein